jgi:hypothetical protein
VTYSTQSELGEQLFVVRYANAMLRSVFFPVAVVAIGLGWLIAGSLALSSGLPSATGMALLLLPMSMLLYIGWRRYQRSIIICERGVVLCQGKISTPHMFESITAKFTVEKLPSGHVSAIRADIIPQDSRGRFVFKRRFPLAFEDPKQAERDFQAFDYMMAKLLPAATPEPDASPR